MSESRTRRRIQAQSSANDAQVMGFLLDAALQDGAPARFVAAGAGAPLPDALFAIGGLCDVEVSGATIWVRKEEGAEWVSLKPAIAATIREVLDTCDTPLGQAAPVDADAELLRAVEELLERQVNPSVAAHGGHIAAERVSGGTVYLRM